MYECLSMYTTQKVNHLRVIWVMLGVKTMYYVYMSSLMKAVVFEHELFCSGLRLSPSLFICLLCCHFSVLPYAARKLSNFMPPN